MSILLDNKTRSGIGSNRRYCKNCKEYKYSHKDGKGFRKDEVVLRCPDCNYRMRNKTRTGRKVESAYSLEDE